MKLFLYLCILFILLIVIQKLNILEHQTNYNELSGIINPKYVFKLTKLDLKIRGLENKDVSVQYLNSIRRINTIETNILNNMFDDIDDNIIDYKYILDIKFNIYIINKHEIFPHTHFNNIFLPDKLKLTDGIKPMLLHEKIHIVQRVHEHLFYELYTRYWNFKRTKIRNLDIIEYKSRTNPDGLDNNWIFSYNKTNILLIALYNDNPSDISDVTLYGINVNKENEIIVPIEKNKLDKIPEFINFFGMDSSGNNYHPNELSAEMLTNILLTKTHSQNEGYSQLKKWWSTIV